MNQVVIAKSFESQIIKTLPTAQYQSNPMIVKKDCGNESSCFIEAPGVANHQELTRCNEPKTRRRKSKQMTIRNE
jgi:hypothetical protein